MTRLSNSPRPARTYRIAYLIDGLSMGGAERLMVPVLKYLSRAHFEPYVCAMQSKDGNPMAEELRALGVPVECLDIQHLRDLGAIPRLARYLKKIGADLVHTQLEAANILGNISAKLLGLPSVCTIHVMPSLDVKTKTRLHQKVEWLFSKQKVHRGNRAIVRLPLQENDRSLPSLRRDRFVFGNHPDLHSQVQIIHLYLPG